MSGSLGTFAMTLVVLTLFGSAAIAASVRIEDAQAARAYVDKVFTENACSMSFAQIDSRMRVDGIIPTQAEMISDIGVTKFIRQRRVMGALEELFRSGDIQTDESDTSLNVSKFGGCA